MASSGSEKRITVRSVNGFGAFWYSFAEEEVAVFRAEVLLALNVSSEDALTSSNSAFSA